MKPKSQRTSEQIAILTSLGGRPHNPGSLHRATRIGLAVLLALSQPFWAATIIVDETTCTLVDAITAANRNRAVGGCPSGSGADTIQLLTDVTLIAVDNTSDYYGPNGLPRIASDITIEGGGFTIERDVSAPPFRLIEVLPAGTLLISDVTLTNGDTELGGGAIRVGPGATLDLTNSKILGNSADGGGGIVNSNGASTTLVNSTVSGNGGPGFSSTGGGIENVGLLTLTNSTVSGNGGTGLYPYGGGISNGGTAIITNSTISGNWGAWGSAINNGIFGTVTLTNSTVSSNTGVIIGGSIYSYSDGGSVTMTNTIVANNTGDNCDGGEFTDGGNNFADDSSCGSGFASITPGEDFDSILADNGGPTQTHALLPDSVAIDAAGACGLATDQRGRPRDDGTCDSGSFEVQCEISVTRDGANTLIYFTQSSSEFDLVAGYLSDLHIDGDFSQSTCAGEDLTSPTTDTLPEPIAGDGRYYLARGLTRCIGAGYGDSSMIPDPRAALISGPCP